MAAAQLMPTKHAGAASPFACFGGRVAPESEADDALCVYMDVLPSLEGVPAYLKDSKRTASLVIVRQPDTAAYLTYSLGGGPPVTSRLPLKSSLELSEDANRRPAFTVRAARSHAVLYKAATTLIPQLVALLAEVSASPALCQGQEGPTDAEAYLKYTKQGLLISYKSPDSPQQKRLVATLIPNGATGQLELQRTDPSSQLHVGRPVGVTGLYGALAHLGIQLPLLPPGSALHAPAAAPLAPPQERAGEGPTEDAVGPAANRGFINDTAQDKGMLDTAGKGLMDDVDSRHGGSEGAEPSIVGSIPASRALLDTHELLPISEHGTPTWRERTISHFDEEDEPERDQGVTLSVTPTKAQRDVDDTSDNKSITAHRLSEAGSFTSGSDLSQTSLAGSDFQGNTRRRPGLKLGSRSISTDPSGRDQNEPVMRWGQRFGLRTMTTPDEVAAPLIKPK